MVLRAITKDKEIIGIIDDYRINNKDLIGLLAVLPYPISIIAMDVALKEYGCKLSAGLGNLLNEYCKNWWL